MHRRAQAPLARVLTDREAATLLAVADGLASGEARDPRPAFMLRLLLDTGLKKGELVRLRTDDLNLDADPPSILVRYDQPRFARKERRVPVGPKVSGLFPAYLLRYRTAERLFPWTDRNLEYVLADLASEDRRLRTLASFLLMVGFLVVYFDQMGLQRMAANSSPGFFRPDALSTKLATWLPAGWAAHALLSLSRGDMGAWMAMT